MSLAGTAGHGIHHGASRGVSRGVSAYDRRTHPPERARSGRAARQKEHLAARAPGCRRFAELLERYDVLVTPGANTPAFDVDLRHHSQVHRGR